MDAVRSFRVWVGPYCGMTAGFAVRVAHSSLHAALHRDDVANLGVHIAIITGCGGDSADVASFVRVWRRHDAWIADVAAAGCRQLTTPAAMCATSRLRLRHSALTAAGCRYA